MAVTSGLTAEEYFVATDGDPRTQLVDGEIVVNSPNIRHQRIADFLLFRLTLWCVAEPGRGEAGSANDLRLDDRNVYAPDVWWVPEERRLARDALRREGAADMIVEVLSPSTRRYDLGRKRAGYEFAGARELWLVDPSADKVTVHRRSAAGSQTFDLHETLVAEGGAVLTTPLLPGFALDLDDLFDR